jgi:hypothetical protein
MAKIEWRIEGPHFVNCNCAYGCPCQYVALPTDNTCKAVVGFCIDKGFFGDTRLDGLLAVNVYSWPNPIHEGNGSMQSVIDARANAAQREALAAILQGEGADPGSTMLQIYRAMCSEYHAPVFAPITLEIDMETRSANLSIPGIVETQVEPLRNPVTGAEHRARIDLPNGKEFRVAEVASGTTRASGAVSFEFAKRHAHFAAAALTSGGIAA